MIRIHKLQVLLILITVILAGSYVYAGNFDLANCDWNADRIKLRIENVPPATRVAVCVEEVPGDCDIKAQKMSTPAGADGVVVVIVEKQGGRAFAAGNAVRISDPDCAVLSGGGTLTTSTECGECVECAPEVPSFSAYGLILLALIIALTGVWIYRRKRAGAVT